MEFEKLKDIIVDVMGCNPDEITMDTTFVDDLGADSLDIFQIIMGIEDAFDIEIENENEEILNEYKDFADMFRLMEKLALILRQRRFKNAVN